MLLTIVSIIMALQVFVGCDANGTVLSPDKQLRVSATPLGTPLTSSVVLPGRIDPGIGIGPLILGINYNSANIVMGKPVSDNVYSPPACDAREVRWIAHLKDATPVVMAVFSPDGTVEQIQTELRGFETGEGVKNGDTLSEFSSKYEPERLQIFADRGIRSNSKSVEGYSVYFVDANSGVAFRFTKNRQDRIWYVDSIYVFNIGDDFSRWRYCNPTDKAKFWLRLSNADLDSAPELSDNT